MSTKTPANKKQERPADAPKNRYVERQSKSVPTFGLKAATANSEGQLAPLNLPLEALQPDTNQPRKHFDEPSLEELAASIQARGVLQPIRVRPEGERYTIISGERRYRAARMAGLRDIPVIIETREDYSALDQAIDALVENLQRDDLNVVEEVEGIYQLIRMRASIEIGKDEAESLDYEAVTQAFNRMRNHPEAPFEELEGVIERTTRELGLSWKTIAIKKATVWKWPPELVQALREQSISLEVARVLKSIEDDVARSQWLQRAIEEKLSASKLRTRLTAEAREQRGSLAERAPQLRQRLHQALEHVEARDPQRVNNRLRSRVESLEKALAALEAELEKSATADSAS